MLDVGSQLRAGREAKGLTIDQAFKATRIKAIYLEALEANRVDALPGLVQARGFVRSYANFLGLDGESLASTLDSNRAALAPEPVALPAPRSLNTSPAPKAATSVSAPIPAAPDRAVPRRTIELPSIPKIALSSKPDTAPASPGGIPTSVLIVGAIVLFVIGAVLVLSALTSNSQSVPDSNLPQPANTVLASVEEIMARPSGPVSITLTAREHVWARITVDGLIAFEGMLDPAAPRTIDGDDQIVVETGNAAALTIEHHGRSDVLGERGRLVAREFHSAGSTDVPLTVTRGGFGAPISTSPITP